MTERQICAFRFGLADLWYALLGSWSYFCNTALLHASPVPPIGLNKVITWTMNAVLIALWTIVMVPHDYFISILTMRHDPVAHTIDMTWQMTAHDVEHALENVVDLKLGSQREHPKADSLLNVYFMEHLQLNRDSTQLQWQWIGKELEGENLFCYMQVKNIHEVAGLRISNTLLQDVFTEQQNKVIIERVGGPTNAVHNGGTVWTYTFNLGDGPVLYGE